MSASPLAATVDIDRWPECHREPAGSALPGALRAGPRAPAQRPPGLPRTALRPRPRIARAALDPARSAGHDRPGRDRTRQPSRHRPSLRHLARRGRAPAGRPGDRPRRPGRRGAGALHRHGPLGATQRSGSIRRRFEVNDGILGWGSGAFAAIAHLDNDVLDWRGPHPSQEPGRYAPTGQSGSLTIMPGTYGTSQTGDDRLRAQRHRRRAPLAPRDRARHCQRAGRPPARAAQRRPPGQRPDRRGGHGLFLARAIRWLRSPRFQVRIDGLAGDAAQIDLGTIIRTRRAPGRCAAPPASSAGAAAATNRLPAAGPSVIVDLAMAPDGVLSLGDWRIGGPRPGGRQPRRGSRRPPLDRAAACCGRAGRCRDRRPGQRRTGPGARPVHDRRRPLPAAARSSRRGQPRTSSRTPAPT